MSSETKYELTLAVLVEAASVISMRESAPVSAKFKPHDLRNSGNSRTLEREFVSPLHLAIRRVEFLFCTAIGSSFFSDFDDAVRHPEAASSHWRCNLALRCVCRFAF